MLAVGTGSVAPGAGLCKPGRPCQTGRIMDLFLEPGVLVRCPSQPDWGLGQVQSVVGPMVTVNFEDAGKKTINAEHVDLTYVGDNPRDRR